MATLLGKSNSFCYSCVLSEKCFVVYSVFSFPCVVCVGTLNFAPIVGPSMLTMYSCMLSKVMRRQA